MPSNKFAKNLDRRGKLTRHTLAILLIAVANSPRSYADADQAAPSSDVGSRDSEAKPVTDSLGDSLPDGALLRLGTLRFRPPSTVRDIGLTADEKTVVTIGAQLIAWDAATGKQRWRVDANQFGFDSNAASYGSRGLAFSSDPSRFYTPGRQDEVIVWDVLSGEKEVIRIKSTDEVPNAPRRSCRSIDVTPDGQTIALGSPSGVVVISTQDRRAYEITNNPKDEPIGGKDRDRLKFGGPYSLARFSPDGSLLAVVTSDTPESIRLYESTSGQELRRIALKSRLVRLAFSPDGKHIAATERDSAVRLYDVDSTKEVWSHVVELKNPYENYTSAIAYSPDGKTVAACATDERIHQIDTATGKEIAALAGHTWYPWAVAFTADSKMLYSSGWDGAVRRWDVAAREQLALPQGIRGAEVVTASPDGRTLAYEDDLATIRLVDARDGTERRTIKLAGVRFGHLAFSADGRQIAGGGGSGDNVCVAVWNLPSGELVRRWDWPRGRDPHSTVESLCFSPNGSRLAAAVFRQSKGYLWDLASSQRIADLPHKEIYGLSFSPDGQTLATAGWDRAVRFWETAKGELTSEAEFEAPPDGNLSNGDVRMYTACYAPQGGLLATAHLDGMVRVWQADDMTLRHKFQIPGRFYHGSINFSPDGLWLATGNSTGNLALWDPLTGQRVWDVGRHQDSIYTVGFGCDSRTMVSGGSDGVCYRWDLRPAEAPPDKDLAGLWGDLAGEDSPAAYRAIWALSAMPDRAVTLLAEKLRAVKSVVDVDRVGTSVEEVQRLKQLKTLLANKQAGVERAIAVRRALSLLGQLGTREAIRLLEELANPDSSQDIRQLAAAQLARSDRSREAPP